MTLGEADVVDLCKVDSGELATAQSQTPQLTSNKKANVFVLIVVSAAPTISNKNLISGLYFKHKPGLRFI